MTDKKAIENLKLIRKQFNKYDFTHALDMAIEALSERSQNELSCTNCDRFGQDCGDCEVNDDD